MGKVGALPEVTQVARGGLGPRPNRPRVFSRSVVLPRPLPHCGTWVITPPAPRAPALSGAGQLASTGRPCCGCRSHIPQPRDAHNHCLCSKSSLEPGSARLPGRPRSRLWNVLLTFTEAGLRFASHRHISLSALWQRLHCPQGPGRMPAEGKVRGQDPAGRRRVSPAGEARSRRALPASAPEEPGCSGSPPRWPTPLLPLCSEADPTYAPSRRPRRSQETEGMHGQHKPYLGREKGERGKIKKQKFELIQNTSEQQSRKEL